MAKCKLLPEYCFLKHASMITCTGLKTPMVQSFVSFAQNSVLIQDSMSFLCTYGCELRSKLMDEIKKEAPEQLWNELMKGDKMMLLLTCFGSSPLTEWLSLYDAVIEFMYQMYKHRNAATKENKL